MSSVPAPAAAPRLPRWVWPAVALAATCLAYLGTLQFQFVYDDGGQIVTNLFIRQWKYLPAYFQTHVWAQFNLHATSNYFRPAFMIWMLLNYKAFGLNAAGWHFTTVLAHLGVTYLVYRFALRLTGRDSVAGIAALLFGVLPVHVEAVAWISGITEPLFALLLLAAFLCYLNFRERKGRRWLAFSLLLFALAQFSKETAAIMAVLVGVYELLFPLAGEEKLRAWPQRIGRAAALGLPYAAITAFYIVLRIHALGVFSITNFPVSPGVNLLTLPLLLSFYLRLLVWPAGLSAFYDLPYVTAPTLGQFVLPLLLVVAVIALLAWIGARSRSRVYLYLLFWGAVTLAPVLNLKYFVQGELAHDRYLYTPSIAFCVLAAMALSRIPWGRISLANGESVPLLPVGAIAVVLLAATIWQSTFWANNLLLYKRGVDIAPRNLIARTDLGNALYDAGRPQEALELYRECLAVNPNFWLAAYDLGYVHYKLGHYDLAQNYLVHAAEIYPVDGDTFYYLGLTEQQMGHLERAQQALEQALRNEPRAIGYRLALGRVYKAEGKLPDALAMFRGELEKNPGDAATLREIAETEAKLDGK